VDQEYVLTGVMSSTPPGHNMIPILQPYIADSYQRTDGKVVMQENYKFTTSMEK